jgi:phage shock protein A
MSYFSRLTDIVTCNLSLLLAEADDPAAALDEIIAEMREGLAGAKRSVSTATATEAALAEELDMHRQDAAQWEERARAELMNNHEDEARRCLVRKQEAVDLLAGLEQQHRSALATKDHLATMQRALEARLAEALRRLESLGRTELAASPAVDFTPPASAADANRQVDAELERLKRQMGLK